MASIALPRALRLTFTGAVLAFLAGSCATSEKVDDTGKGGGTTPPDPVSTEVCRLHSCDIDDECGGCEGGKRTCLVDEHRCVACDPVAGGCAEGESCSEFGACIPQGQTCESDAAGTPTLTCASSLDCLACDSLHQVCDPASGRCVTCTDDDVSACADTRACHAGRCAECSAEVPCPEGATCSPGGSCEAACGTDGVPCETTAGGGGGGAGGGGMGGAGGGGSTGCHDVCAAGDAMDKACDPCTTKLCASDDYCCSTAWDQQCVGEVGQYCDSDCGTLGAGGGGSTGGEDTCAHDVCDPGDSLNPFCSDCALAVCGDDPFCCAVSWDASCVTEVGMYCSSGC
jgi:hypothetical protein